MFFDVMRGKDKIKVVWLCHFSNAFVHEKLDLKFNHLIGLLRHIVHQPISIEVPEFANWITNGIIEFEKRDDVELHVISPYSHLKSKIQEFSEKHVYYHFFQNEDDSIYTILYKKFFRPDDYKYSKNRKTIEKLIKKIKPDIVHLFGAENPDYATGVFSIPKDVIIIAQLQTLLSDPNFKSKYPIDEKIYNYRAKVEKNILLKADYLGTIAKRYRDIIHNDITHNAIILNTTLALKDPIVMSHCDKQFDFVYFAADIKKAADLAIEAFGIAFQKDHSITLDIIGDYSQGYMHEIDVIIDKYGVREAIRFEGKLPTHEDVLKQIRKSRFALLPLKIDLVSGTIREAMSNGLPVITTDTGVLGTQLLNVERPCALLSAIGDHRALAENMLRILDDKGLADELRQNSYQSRQEALSNMDVVGKYVEAYRACLEHQMNNSPLPKELTEI